MGRGKFLIGAMLVALLSCAAVGGQSVAPAVQTPSANRADIESFDDFLDAHGNVARVLRRNPAVVHNEEFLNNHPELDEFLKNHPGIEAELRQHPGTFVRRERRFGEAGEHVSRYELDTFDHLLEMHQEAAAELRSNPALVDDENFLRHHADLREFFEDHPHVRENLKRRPWAFVDAEGASTSREHEQPVVFRPKQ